MKKTILTFCFILLAGCAVAAETTKVCVDKTDKAGKPILGKDGKATQQCKIMKVHKKLEGTEVPGQKK